jgi:calcium/calmodulin-dependent protein kinase (CaM kinase) II
MSNESTTVAEILELNRRLLESITEGDWATYQELCDPSLTAFEPEARGYLAEGMDFHHFYFQLGGVSGPHNITVCAPHVRVLGDVAIVSYVRLVQKLNETGSPLTSRSEETRVWHRQDGKWRQVHCHRSTNG